VCHRSFLRWAHLVSQHNFRQTTDPVCRVDTVAERHCMFRNAEINGSSFSFCGRLSSQLQPACYQPDSDSAARPFSPSVWQRLFAQAKAFAISCPPFFAGWFLSRVAFGPSQILRLGCCLERDELAEPHRVLHRLLKKRRHASRS
jgi:hypothetical protein